MADEPKNIEEIWSNKQVSGRIEIRNILTSIFDWLYKLKWVIIIRLLLNYGVLTSSNIMAIIEAIKSIKISFGS